MIKFYIPYNTVKIPNKNIHDSTNWIIRLCKLKRGDKGFLTLKSISRKMYRKQPTSTGTNEPRYEIHDQDGSWTHDPHSPGIQPMTCMRDAPNKYFRDKRNICTYNTYGISVHTYVHQICNGKFCKIDL